MFDDDLDIDYTVVVNDEEQYSIWPTDATPPNGWRPAGRSGPKPDCLEWIEATWTDMRPKSTRDHVG